MEYLEENKKLWENHFEHVRLDYPNEDLIRFLVRSKQLYDRPIMMDWGCATGRYSILGMKLGYDVYLVDYVKHYIDVTRENQRKT